jgi:hypothetical protein
MVAFKLAANSNMPPSHAGKYRMLSPLNPEAARSKCA